MTVVYWDVTPWYLRILGKAKYRRRVRLAGSAPRFDYWEYYDCDKHGRGMFF